jgi:hypothetical protein
MFQPGAEIAKVGLVQFPCACVGPSNKRGEEGTAVEVVVVELVDDVGAVVEVVDEAPVLVPPLDEAVVVGEPAGAGSL